MSFDLPDRARWRVGPEGRSFLELDHAASDSELFVRLWDEPGAQSRASCEAAARQRRDLPEIPEEGALDRQHLSVPAGFDTEVRVAVLVPATAKGQLQGVMLAFGASGRSCFAFGFVTRATGPGAEAQIADRLALVHTVSLQTVRLARAGDPLPRSER